MANPTAKMAVDESMESGRIKREADQGNNHLNIIVYYYQEPSIVFT